MACREIVHYRWEIEAPRYLPCGMLYTYRQVVTDQFEGVTCPECRKSWATIEHQIEEQHEEKNIY